MEDSDLSLMLEVAMAAARIGGDVLDSWSERFTVSEKARADLVTEADLEAQNAIHRHLSSIFPDHGFLGEEGLSEPQGDSRYQWIIDPLDGTSNYVHGFPYYCVSIGLKKDTELVGGVVFDPNRDEMFFAGKSQGAFLNRKPIQPTDTADVGQAMTMASLPRGSGAEDPAVARFLQVLPHAQTVQRSGSATLNLVYVACGRIDAFWSSSLKPWDMAAGAAIITEAGGRVSKLGNGPFDVSQPEILASNGTSLHDELVRLLE
ncbi:inositol monophosphatase family protein [Thalassoroseus pseudoceratinae]|uniref:inositol monophosphatase family protein n=1 Tax=Thalassoroseus pseudoceratinae TaxID=2713176 RepID=UPI00141E9329|nr:inositol monophosphatase family protein [Thalassoroseus pseudoceratinae]